MNLVSAVLSLFRLKNSLPLSVHYSYIRPLLHPIPKEISEHQGVVTSFVGLENFSAKVLRNIRIKLKSKLEFAPQLKSNLRTNVGYTYDKDIKEIIIESIDPKESIAITLYPSLKPFIKDFEPEIIINDELLTRGMKSMGYYQKYPSFFLMNVLMAFAVLMLITIIYMGEDIYKYLRKPDPDYALVQDAKSKLDGKTCVLKAIKVKSDLDWYLKKSPMPLGVNLKLNNVFNINELKELEKAVICLPEKLKI